MLISYVLRSVLKYKYLLSTKLQINLSPFSPNSKLSQPQYQSHPQPQAQHKLESAVT